MIRFIKLLWFDITGYFYVKKTIRKHKNTVDYNKYGLRADWVARIYTVINPSEADKGDSEDVLKIKAQEKIVAIHKYIDKIGLSEYVAVSAEKIPETNSYLLVYYPIFNVLSVWRVFVFFLSLGIITYFLFKYTNI